MGFPSCFSSLGYGWVFFLRSLLFIDFVGARPCRDSLRDGAPRRRRMVLGGGGAVAFFLCRRKQRLSADLLLMMFKTSPPPPPAAAYVAVFFWGWWLLPFHLPLVAAAAVAADEVRGPPLR